jgi:hypothetical protein
MRSMFAGHDSIFAVGGLDPADLCEARSMPKSDRCSAGAARAGYRAPKKASVPTMATPSIRMVRSVAMLCFDRWVMAESSIAPILGPTTADSCDPSTRGEVAKKDYAD